MNSPGRLETGTRGGVVLIPMMALVLCGVLQAQDTSTEPQVGETTDSVSTTQTPGAPFQIHVQGADIRDVLRMLAEDSQRNIVATREVTGKVTADLYDVTFKEALDAVLRANGFGYLERGNIIYVYTQSQLRAALEAEREIGSRLYRLAYVTAADAKALIEPALTEAGSISITPAANVGIDTSSTDAGGNAYAAEDVLVVIDYEDNLKEIDKLVRDLDAKPEQVLIEATVLRATLTEDNKLGIDFNMLAGVDFEALGGTTTGVTDLDTADATDVAGLGRAATFRTDFNSSITGGGMSIGFLSNNVAFFIRALEGITDVSVLANPKLLVINKQRGEVIVGNRDGYLTTTVTDTVATQTVEFLETGTRLIVRPYIGKDGYIRMEIHPEDSSGSVSQVGTSVLPEETTTEVTSNVLIRDGHTIVIGGLFREETKHDRSQVPVLGDVPYVGPLFRNTLDHSKREEVIVLVTPHIVKQDEAEALGEQLMDEVERFRVGMRKGLRWWGRDRMAQSYLREAKQFLREGRPDKALWNVDMALSMQPHMHQAITLKERMTNKAYWSDEARHSAIRFLIRKMVMQEMGKPVDQVVPPDRPLDSGQIDPDVRKAFGIIPAPKSPSPDIQKDYEELIKEIPAPTDTKTREQAKPSEGSTEEQYE